MVRRAGSGHPSLRAGFRYIDDYELSAETHDQAAALIATVQDLLSEYELEVNPVKTSILPLPLPLEYPWASELRSLPLRGDRTERSDLIRLFDRAVDYVRQSPNEPILRYLLGRIKNVGVVQQNWRLYQELLLQCVTVEPGCLVLAASHLMRHANAGLLPDSTLVQEFLNRFIAFHAPLGHDNEVAWALWLSLALELILERDAIEAIQRLDGPVVVLETLHAEQAGMLACPLDKTRWESMMTAEALSDKAWLLAYEATGHGWLGTVGGQDIVGNDRDFAFLRTLGIEFYDASAVTALKPTGVAPSFGVAPLFAVYDAA